MGKESAIRFPEEGLIKTTDLPSSRLGGEQKVGLNRKGNELFNSGDIEAARRIFLTTGYSDGLIRVGDFYMGKEKPIDALKMYWLAHAKNKSEELIQRMALVIQKFLKEEEQNGRADDDSGQRA
jgi:hypothetical protein